MKIRMHIQDGTKSYDFEHTGVAIAIGRNPAGDVVLEETGANSVVSWDHARIILSPSAATLSDLRSTNGTYRNGETVRGTVEIQPNDSIRFGQTGPVLSVRSIDLTPAVVSPAKTAVPPPLPTSNRKSAAPVASATRGIAMEAVRQLQSHEESLRKQQQAQARQRRLTALVAGAALAMFLLLGSGLLVYSGKLNLLGHRVNENEASLKKLGEDMRSQAERTAEHFANIDRDAAAQSESHKEALAKIDQFAQASIAQEAKLHGGMDQLKKDLGASLVDLNLRLNPTPIQPPDAPPTVPPRTKPSPRIEPGTKMDVLHKNGNFYTGVLLAISNTEVSLQTHANAGAKPSKFDLRDVRAFQTRDGIFALDETTREFEPAVTFYRFNKASGAGEFERIESQSSGAFMIEDAQVLGPTNSAKALLALGQQGEWCIGLPIRLSQSPNAIPAYHFKEIVTSKGVYTYDNDKHEFSYKSHGQLAAEAKAAIDEHWRKVDEKIWARRVQTYQLTTERVRALSSYYGRVWWWW